MRFQISPLIRLDNSHVSIIETEINSDRNCTGKPGNLDDGFIVSSMSFLVKQEQIKSRTKVADENSKVENSSHDNSNLFII